MSHYFMHSVFQYQPIENKAVLKMINLSKKIKLKFRSSLEMFLNVLLKFSL